MPIRISDALEVDHGAFAATGAFDACIDVDSRLYVDPYLLQSVSAPELARSYSGFQRYFADVIRLLKATRLPGDVMWRAARRKLTFPELRGVGLGFSLGKPSGSGIGPGLAGRLLGTAQQIVAAGIEDPTIFELVGLLEEGVGADRVSDMTVRIIAPDLLSFSGRVASVLGLPTRDVMLRDHHYAVPCVPGVVPYLVLIPGEVLRNLPVAESWDEVDLVRFENEDLRNRVNRIIGTTWRTATRRPSKGELRNVLVRNPSLLLDLLQQYKRKPPRSYDFKSDPAGEVAWLEASKRVVRENPLPLGIGHARSLADVSAVARKIALKFSDLLEKNGLNELLYDKDRDVKPERAAQLLFYGVADAYCAANDLDLSREPNAGRGAVDFKVSAGYSSRVTVEVKLSTNKKLIHGWETQLPIYQAAEQSTIGIYLVIRVSENEAMLKRLMKKYYAEKDKGHTVPEVIVADGRLQPSASHA